MLRRLSPQKESMMLNQNFSLYQHPLLNFAVSTRERLGVVSVCAALPIIQSALQDRGASLIVALAAVAAAVAAELCLTLCRGKAGFKDCSSIVTGSYFNKFSSE